MPFKPGQSGNLAGRPKLVKDVQEFARAYTRENVERIANLAANAGSEKVQLAASIALHEIGWGRPIQQQQVTGANGGPLVVTWMPPQSQS